MQYLRIRNGHGKRADGGGWARASVIRKTRKYGEVVDEKCISVKLPVLLVGAHGAGKSYWLDRLHCNAARIWSKSGGALRLDAVKPLSSWTDCPALAAWWNGREIPDSADKPPDWAKLPQTKRVDLLALYVAESGAVLFVDDAHLLTGRKLRIVQACLRSARVWVMTASDEGRIAPSLRHDALNAKPQVFRLGSDVAYDATPVLIWAVVFICISLGQWELAGVLGMLQTLSRGRRATKQN